jgi:hypothetical protein
MQVKELGVENAVKIALKNNLELQSQQLNVQSSTYLKKSTFELPKTNVNFQYGQYNSLINDKAFQINRKVHSFSNLLFGKIKFIQSRIAGKPVATASYSQRNKSTGSILVLSVTVFAVYQKAIAIIRQFV